MHAPDDFDLSPVATLAHVVGGALSPWHAPFWAAWHAEFWKTTPRLTPRDAAQVDSADPGVTHQFESFRGARIGCRLLPAIGPTRGGVVVLHGYSDVPLLAKDETSWASLTRLGLAVLLVRVRGYPGSQLDTGPLDRHLTGYITVGLEGLMLKPEDALRWVLPAAVADAANACRALHAHLAADLPATPLFIRGESFGAGLAVIAAAQLASRLDIHRLALGLPTLGDWSWRLALPDARIPRTGMNREVRELLIQQAARHDEILSILQLCDAALHARHVRADSLCKLAFRDDVVPAPTQAAIFNALAAPRGMKHRFVTRFGHFDGGLANARRHAEFDRLVEAFLNPAADVTALA